LTHAEQRFAMLRGMRAAMLPCAAQLTPPQAAGGIDFCGMVAGCPFHVYATGLII